jgi:hypothetical protein
MNSKQTKTTLKWIAGIILLLAGSGTLLEGFPGITTGILWILAGAICLPPLLSYIENKWQYTFESVPKYVAVIALFILGSLAAPERSKSSSTESKVAGRSDNYSLTEESSDNAATKESFTSATVSEVKSNHISEAEKTINQLKRELESLKDGINTESYVGDVVAVQMELALFGAYKNIIEEGEAINTTETNKLASQLKSKVLSLQRKEFPRMRKAYANAVAQKVWEEDMYVDIGGSGNTTISFTSALFVTNKNIKAFQTEVDEVLRMFRFKQVRYRWYRESDEYTYYKLDTPPDGELVSFSQ